MKPGIEGPPVPDDDVQRRRNSTRGAVAALRQAIGRLVEAIDDQENIIVAVRTGFPPRLGPKEVDPPRLQADAETAYDLSKNRVLIQQCSVYGHAATQSYVTADFGC